MKALALTGYGMDGVVFTDVDDPQPAPDEVVVSVRAAGLNHLDLWTLSGDLGIKHHWPHVLGADAAGEVARVGSEVRGIKPGTRVIVYPGISCGACEFCRAGEQSLCTTFHMLGEHVPGTFAESAVVPSRNIFPVPDHLSMEEAATLGVTYVTAYRMLFSRGRLKPGEWVLVTGIGGGLAQALFQLARPIAGRILVTSSSDDKLRRALEEGADEAINYHNDDVGRAVRARTAKRGVDLVVDSAGGESLDACARALRKGGRLLLAGGTAGRSAELGLSRLFWNQLEIIGSTMGSTADVSDTLRMLAGTRIKPRIDRTFPLAEGRRALEYLSAQEQVGKVVLTL